MLEDDGLFVTHRGVRGCRAPAGISPVRAARLARFAGPPRRGRLAGPCAERPDGRAHLRQRRLARAAPQPAIVPPPGWPAPRWPASEHFWSQAIIADVLHHQYRRGVPDPWPSRRRRRRRERAPVDRGGGGLRPRPRPITTPLLILASPLFLACAAGAGRGFRTPGRLPGRRPPRSPPRPPCTAGWRWRSHQPAPVNFLGADRVLGRVPLLRRPQHLLPHRPEPQRRPADKLFFAGHFATQALLQFGVVGTLVALWGRVHVFPGRLASRALVRGAGVRGQQLPPRRPARLQLRTPSGSHLPPLSAGRLLHPRAMAGARRARAVRMGARAPRAAASRFPRRGRALLVAGLCAWNAGVNYRPHDRFAEEQAQGAARKSPRRTAFFVLYADTVRRPRCPIFTG